MTAAAAHGRLARFRDPRSALRHLAPTDFLIPMLIIAAIGVVIRVVYTLHYAPWPPPGFTDESFYYLEPRLLTEGHGFVNPILVLVGRVQPTALHPPLYPLVLAGLRELGGSSQQVMRLTGSVFGAGIIFTLGWLGRRLGGDRVGLLAGAIAAVYPMFITADGALMSESLYGLLVALALLGAYRLREVRALGRAIVLGLILGLAALVRGEALLLTPLLLIAVVRRPGGVRAAVLTCLTVLLVLTPWTIRNVSVFHRFVLISDDASSALAGANCPASYYGSGIGGWYITCIRPHPGNEAETLARAQSDGISYATRHLGRVPRVILAREMMVWGLRPLFALGSSPPPPVEGRSPTALRIGFLMYDVLVILAVYGFFVLRRRGAPTWNLIATFVSVALTTALFYGNVRFREPADLALVVLAAAAVDQLWRRLRPEASRHQEPVGRKQPAPAASQPEPGAPASTLGSDCRKLGLRTV